MPQGQRSLVLRYLRRVVGAPRPGDLTDADLLARFVTSRDEAEKADFVISGPYSRWKQVSKKELDATKGIMLGQLKLRGDFPTIVRYTKASQEMTECTTRVPVEWPDE